ncbi:hypothetical protein C8R43DRAFT_709421 [Mycena crocata]|nr:hypothetical protein C8R43DRAFT_709421 [Mycena crocata]
MHFSSQEPGPCSEPAVWEAAAMPSYFRTLSPNELSYFLPSREYGLNDMYLQLIVRAPPNLVSPLRLRIAWAIMRLRHTLLASKIEMEPGCYDGARFKYTPPASPSKAVDEVGDTLQIYDDRTGPDLVSAFIDPAAPRTLSAEQIARLDVARHGPVAPGIEEYHLVFMLIHAVSDGVTVYRHSNMILELLGGSATVGGRPRTNAELLHLLGMEWTVRWGVTRTDEVIIAATEDQLPVPRTKLQEAAWKVEHQNVLRRAVGGHVFPRVKTKATKHVLLNARFTRLETQAMIAKCKSQRVTLSHAILALCNYAYIRTEANHPEFGASKMLPTMFYTAVSLRHHLPAPSPLSSYMSLALAYCNVVLPSFVPPSADPHAMLWHRARSAKTQMSGYARSPLLFGRSQMMSVERALRAKAFAAQDDEAAGIVPRRTVRPPPLQPPPATSTVPSAALLGLSFLGDLDPLYRAESYPQIQVLDAVGHVRKARGGILLFTQIFQQQFTMTLGWDTVAFEPDVIEEFWEHFVGGVRGFLIQPTSHQSSRL